MNNYRKLIFNLIVATYIGNASAQMVCKDMNIVVNSGVHLQGDLTIKEGSNLVLKSHLLFGANQTLNVDSGGFLTLKSNSKIFSYGHFSFNVNAGGVISAEYAKFEKTDTMGVNIKPGARIDSLYAFYGCSFKDGQPGGSLLTVNNEQNITIKSAEFPENTWESSYNVSKINDAGIVNFIDSKYDFSGESFENDPFNRINWYENHRIVISEGWSGISSFIMPAQNDIISVFSPINSSLVIVHNNNGIFYPALEINTIISWASQSAYIVKVTNQCVLNIVGFQELNKIYDLNAGWNILPVISQCNVPIESLFEETSIFIIKEVAGLNVYWPEFNINTIGVLEPGRAYFVMMDEDDQIIFPECSKLKAWPDDPPIYNNDIIQNTFNNIPSQYKKLRFEQYVNTASSHTIAIPISVATKFSAGDFILAYDHSGSCFGVCILQCKSMTITLFGNDPTTPLKDGFDENEPLQFVLFRAETNEEIPLEVSLDQSLPNSEPVFVTNGLSAFSKIQVSTSGISDYSFAGNIQIIPNPAKDEFTLVLPNEDFKECVLEIYRVDGQFVKQESITLKQTKVDIAQLNSGIFILKIEIDGKTFTKRLIKH